MEGHAQTHEAVVEKGCKVGWSDTPQHLAKHVVLSITSPESLLTDSWEAVFTGEVQPCTDIGSLPAADIGNCELALARSWKHFCFAWLIPGRSCPEECALKLNEHKDTVFVSLACITIEIPYKLWSLVPDLEALKRNSQAKKDVRLVRLLFPSEEKGADHPSTNLRVTGASKFVAHVWQSAGYERLEAETSDKGQGPQRIASR